MSNLEKALDLHNQQKLLCKEIATELQIYVDLVNKVSELQNKIPIWIQKNADITEEAKKLLIEN